MDNASPTFQVSTVPTQKDVHIRDGDFYAQMQIHKNLRPDNIIKYFLHGIAVGLAAYSIPKRKSGLSEALFIAITASATFLLLDSIHHC